MKKAIKNIYEEEQEQQKVKKLLRQQKAAIKFSKQRFMRIPLQNSAIDHDIQVYQPNSHQAIVKRNLKVDMIEVLKKMGVDFQNPQKSKSWLSLSWFDYLSHDDLIIPAGLQIQCRCLLKINGKFDFHRGVVYGYEVQKEKYKFSFTNSENLTKNLLVPRLYLCLNSEDPYRHCQRISKAFFSRIYSDNSLKLNYYINNMPTQGLSDISIEQREKIKRLVESLREFPDIEKYFPEVQDQYWKSMNSIIIKKHLKESRNDIVPCDLIVSFGKKKSNAPQFGLIKINRDIQVIIENNARQIEKGQSFVDIFKKHCENSLRTKKPIITSLQLIKIQCEKLISTDLFKIVEEKRQPLREEQFKTEQTSSIQRSINKLKNNWVNGIKQIIQSQVKKGQVSWFDPHCSAVNYHQSKTSKYFKLVKFIMENALSDLTVSSFTRYTNYISGFIPKKVEIKSINEVINYYEDGTVINSSTDVINLECKAQKPPLFETDLMKSMDDSIFSYTVKITNFSQHIMSIFCKMLEDLEKIPEVQQKIMLEVFKKQKSEKYLNVASLKAQKNGLGQNKWIHALYDNLKSKLDQGIKPLDDYLNKFNELLHILHIKPDQIVNRMEQEDQESPKDPNYLREEVETYYRKEKQLLVSMPPYIHISFFKIYLKDIVEQLAMKYRQTAKGLQNLIGKKAKKTTKSLIEKFEQIKTTIKSPITSIEQLVKIRDYITMVPLQLEKINKQIIQSNQIYEILEDFRYYLPADDLKKRYMIMVTPQTILQQIEKKKRQIHQKKAQLEEQIIMNQQDFKNTIESLSRSISQFHTYNKKQHHSEIAEKVRAINEALSNAQLQARKFNTRQNLFEREVTDYSKIQDLIKDFTPYSHLWLTTNSWVQNKQLWMYGQWNSVDAEACQKFVEQSIKNLNYAIRVFKQKEIVHILKIAQSIKFQIDQFKPKLPLLLALRKNGLRDRHWKQISQKVGFDVYPDSDFTFSQALNLGLLKHSETCIDIGEQATKQFGIQKSLNQMMRVWDDVKFQFSEFKNNLFIIKSFDEIINIVDDHVATTQSMLFSPYRKPFEEDIMNWFNLLKKISDLIEQWIKLQINWMYLQPIFESSDISKQLIKESKSFKNVDNFWKVIMNRSREMENVLKILNSIDDLFKNISNNNKILDDVQKSLSDYLEKKRGKFARFYFLSNNQLLEILSQAKEPLAVQPYLKKVFQNISQVQFDKNGDKTILAMLSAESERIPFDRIIDPKKKYVEDWMSEVQQQMKQSIRTVLLKSIKDYTVKPREDWVLDHPGQCVLNGSQVHWTTQVQESIKQSKIKQYYEKLKTQLNRTVELVRRKLSKNQSVTLNALIVIDVHARDVVENIASNNIMDINAFQWISQLRYYWQNQNCQTKCVQTVFPYGYQYLGNTLRLVITPLTDKCYMTLMGALKLNLGGAPAGPAGTGKTQTTKDLAKALAKQCVVFNCSDSMDFVMVGKFFKGLASAGAWACFDEFNRINIQVLSVIAQQLLVLFGEKAKGSTIVQFEGSTIKLQKTFSVFITMNPGYAGRTQLPDNLKALFRPVAMMVPDYAMIGQIMLYSFGFKQGRQLAKKMVVTFRLASEQLSSQDHYDYGMRAVRSVINAAGILKERDPDMDEEKLLLRALRDVNVPKFLKDDLPLFQNIIKDLFPGVEKPVINYGALQQEMKKSCQRPQFMLQPIQPFLDKVIQLYDTIQVRHGLMLVGPTGGGKTQSYKILKTSLTSLQKQGYYKVNTHVINPKSITMGELYGMFSGLTQQWTDGVLAYTVRKCCADRSTQKHWIMFDGPVDALWIQNMNTVLDDNKKLCLNSGQILTLTPHMTMMFEVEDLAVASPATVSRCGMVYMQPDSLGISPLYYRWKQTLPDKVIGNKIIPEIIRDYTENVAYPLIQFVRKNCKQTITTINQNLLQSLFKNLNCFLEKYIEKQLVKVTDEDIKRLEQNIKSIFVFCVVWSVGCTTDYEGRGKFNQKLRTILSQKGFVLMPKPFYQYYFNEKTKNFEQWTSMFKQFQIKNGLSYHQIIVPTSDSFRSTHLTKMLLTNGYHTMMPGPIGTGKSINAYNLISTGMGDIYQYIPITFSAQTSAGQTQQTIDSKLDKIRRGVFGAPVGKKYILFVDDFNMPKKEEYGAQPPIQLLRQFLDHHGWYNRKDQQLIRLQNIILLTALGPPGGGRNYITPRIIRHFNIIAYTQMDNITISHIFNCMVEFFFKGFNEQVKKIVPNLISSVISIYDIIRITLLPTPKKSHYTFNLRDISKVFQGICSASLKQCNSKGSIIKLWYHQVFRVFGDRLINNEDKLFLSDKLTTLLPKFNCSIQEIFNSHKAQNLIFCDFWHGKDQDPRHYMEVNSMQKLIQKIYQSQQEYNSDPRFSGKGKGSMKLVLFQDACQHICRIVRIIRQPMGNALLLGVGGSGRQSLAKMGVFISNHRLVYIEVTKNYNINEWHNNIQKILMSTGLGNTQTSFLFTDTQIIDEQMVQDLNSILNSGDVTGIYQEKELDEIRDICKTDCIKKGIQPNKMNIFGQYLSRIKENIHIIMAMSPLNNKFSTRLRMFPSLVNCCTLDWFSQWPQQALLAVGKGQLKDFMQQNNLLEENDTIVQIFKQIHKSVQKISISYLNEFRRYNYVTPMSYLQLLNMFRIVLKQKQNQLNTSIKRLKTGLDKLISANKQVSEMQIKLKDLQPELEKKVIETQELIKTIQIQKADAKETQKIVTKQQEQAKLQTQQALQIAKQVDLKVQDANAKLAESLKAVDKLETKQIVEIKAIKNPHKVAVLVLGGVVIFFQDQILAKGHQIVMKKIEGTIKKEEDWFNTARLQLLENPKNFLEQLKGYDKEHINQALIAKLSQKIMKDPDFVYEKAKVVGGPIEAIYLWIMAMYNFNTIYLNTQPLRQKEAQVKQLVREKTAMLNEKKKILAGVIDKIKNLENKYVECITSKQRLTSDIKQCQIKLDRAKKLTSGLSDQKQRWALQIQTLSSLTKFLPGNSIISSAMISYGGAFTSNFRQQLKKLWMTYIQSKKIDVHHDTNLVAFMGKPVIIQQWAMYGLPKDENSIENGIIIDKGRRWPLMIDPQGQANKYIKNMGKQSHIQGIDIIKQKQDGKLMKTLQLAIQNGKWFLLENVGQQLDKSLEPILLQQIVKTGGSKSITLQKSITYNDSFKMFLTTTMPNPHYSPETFVKVTIINFAITPQGLEDQMLAELVSLQNPQLQQKKKEIVRRNAADKLQLLNIENSILQSLSQGQGGIDQLLLDQTLITQLQNSKKFAAEINQRIQDSKITQQQIDKTRQGYRSVAYRASLLFFCIIDLANIDPMYQYSLQWFVNLFKMAVQNALPAKQLQNRLLNLINYFTYSLYENICRSLFEKHKLLFSFMLTAKVEFGKNSQESTVIDESQWRYLLAGPSGEIKVLPNPTIWISESSWPDIYRQLYGLKQLPKLAGIYDQFMKSPDSFKKIFDSAQPQNQKLPGNWDTKLDSLQKMIVLKAIRMDKVLPAIENWINQKLGKEFIMPPTFDLSKCFKDSTNVTPLIFLLSPGSDPVTDFFKFAKEMDIKADSISLGQGQGNKAQQLVKQARQRGTWALLQNCHLAQSWMPSLQKVVQQFTEQNPEGFRLWLTSMPTNSFPISVLQNGVKMTLQPPQGLRANLLRSYNSITEEQFNQCQKQTEFKKLLFGFCFFHAIIQDRRKFGPIGWNISYQFTTQDLNVCKKQLKMLLDEYAIVPYKVLNYLGAEINYGGRVTDDKDVRLIKTILKKYISPDIFKGDYKFSRSGVYYAPNLTELSDYVTYIQSLPLNPEPQAFGLHANAEITTAQNRTLNLLQSILSIQPRTTSGSGKGREEIIYGIAESIQAKTPGLFNIEQITKAYPTDYNQSMNTVLVQQLVRYNRLIEVMKTSLFNLKKALKGLVVMSQDLEKLSNSIYDNQVGKIWVDKGFLSLKPLGSWIEDLSLRIRFLQNWVNGGTPSTFWMSGFFFPQAFITGSLQNYARKKSIAIDKLNFQFKFLDNINHHSQIKEKPAFGCYIYGVYIQGCRWNQLTHELNQSRPKQLFSQLPMIHLIPFEEKGSQEEAGVYKCPLYKVVSRSGTLSTTGHSTNFVMYINLPTKIPSEEWILSGVATFLALRY